VLKVSVIKSHQKIRKVSITKIIARSLPQDGFSTDNGGISVRMIQLGLFSLLRQGRRDRKI
jgi:hypothetical protein